MAAYPHASDLVLDAGGCRPGLTPELWQPLLQAINPWLTQQPAPRSSSNSRICSSPAGPGASCAKNSRSNARGGAQHSSNGAARSNGAAKCVHLHLQAPPSPQRLLALTQLQQLSHLRLQHTSQSLYSRHLAALSCLGQLESLVLLLSHPRLDLRSLAHQRARRVPLKMDCLSSMQRLTELQLSSQGPAGERRLLRAPGCADTCITVVAGWLDGEGRACVDTYACLCACCLSPLACPAADFVKSAQHIEKAPAVFN